MTYSFDAFVHTISTYVDEILDIAQQSIPSKSDYAVKRWFEGIDCTYLRSDGTWACTGNKDLNLTVSFNEQSMFRYPLIKKGIHDRHNCNLEQADDRVLELIQTDDYPPTYTSSELTKMLKKDFNAYVHEVFLASSEIEEDCINLKEILSSTDEDEILLALSELIDDVEGYIDEYITLHQLITDFNEITENPELDVCMSNMYIYAFKRYANNGYLSIGHDLDAIIDDIKTEIKRYREQK